MPDPSDFDDRASFMEACVPQVLEEGTASNRFQAIAICSSMWDEGRAARMSDTFTRTTIIRAERLSSDGVIEGTLATNGEADDGHIVDIAGMRAEAGVPLLYGHDDFSGSRNLGSWLSFSHIGSRNMRSLGDQELRGIAQIEVERGVGAQKEFRQDMAEMISAGHIRSFSARGRPDPKELPIQRINLPSDHPAYIDPRKAQGMQRYGLFFPRSILAEGSVVSIGSDRKAVMRHLEGLEDFERMRPWLLEIEAEMDPQTALQFYRMAVGLTQVVETPAMAVARQAAEQLRDETDRAIMEELSPESQIPLDEEPETPSEPVETPVEPEPTPVPEPMLDASAPLAERVQDSIRAAFPEFANQAPELIAEMTREVFGTYEEELRQKLDEYAYRHLGRVPPRR